LSELARFTDIGLGDIEWNLLASFEAVTSKSGMWTRVYPSYQQPAYDVPLFSTSFLTDSGTAAEPLSQDEQKIAASTNTSLYIDLEGFSAALNTRSAFNIVQNASISNTTDGVQYNFTLPCQKPLSRWYLQNGTSPVTVDTFACLDGTPNIYVLGLDTTRRAVLFVEEVTVASLTSALFPVRISSTGSNILGSTTVTFEVLRRAMPDFLPAA
jgi:hypothetical protein